MSAAAGATGDSDGTEGEGHDRTDIALPAGQQALVSAVVAAVKPSTRVVVVLFNGGGLAIEQLMSEPGAFCERYLPDGVLGP